MTILNYKELISLPENFDCTSVTKIDVSNCKLRSLTELKLKRFVNLQKLDCSSNELSNLDELVNCTSLQKIYCEYNQLVNLDGITNCTSLERLWCCYNQLTSLLPIRNLRNLQINYYDNPFKEPHHPDVLRILNRDKNNTYDNTQNVHDS